MSEETSPLECNAEDRTFTGKDGAVYTVSEAGGINRQKGKSKKNVLKDENGVQSLFQAKMYIIENFYS